MNSSPPIEKRIRLDDEMTLEKLPDDMLDKILRYLPMKDRIHNSLVSKRLRSVMPYTDQKGCLHVTDLPFKAELKWVDEDNVEVVTDGGVSAALECLLPQPQIGLKLKSLSFASGDRYWEMVASHFDLIIQNCPDLTELSLMDMCNTKRSRFNCGVMRRLTHVTNLHLEEFLGDTAGEDDKLYLNLDMSSLIAMLPLKQLILKDFDFPPSVVAPNLTNLSLKNCAKLNDLQLAQICQTSASLTKLTIEGCGGLHDFTPIRQLRSLTRLELREVRLVDGAMESIAQNLPNLNSLTLGNADVGQLTWLRHLPQLKVFSIWPGVIDSDMADLPDNWAIKELETFNDDLTDVGLEQLSLKCSQLKRLTLDSDGITDVGIDNISVCWDQLEYLKISHAKITGVSLARLGQRKKLQLLVIDSCHHIDTVDGFWLLVVKRQQLGISTPLRIQLDANHVVFAIEMIDQLKEQLKTVGVKLIGAS